MAVGHLGEVLEIVLFHVEVDFKLVIAHVQTQHLNLVVRIVADKQRKRKIVALIPALVSSPAVFKIQPIISKYPKLLLYLRIFRILSPFLVQFLSS